MFTIRYHRVTNARVHTHSYKYTHTDTVHTHLLINTYFHTHTRAEIIIRTHMHKHIHAYTHKQTHTHTRNTLKCLHTFTLYNSTYICKYTQIHLITYRHRLTNTCALAHSEIHARPLTHTYTNMQVFLRMSLLMRKISV